MKKYDKVVGIVGGMGPMAGLKLHSNIIRKTNANKDQDHLSVIHISYAKEIPDRTAFLRNLEFENPAHSITQVVKLLVASGAQCIGIPCNTAHAPMIFDTILEELKKNNIRVPIKNMVEETINFITQNYAPGTSIGIMGTNGTYESEVYSKQLKIENYDVVQPKLEFQEQVIHRMIYDPVFGIKSTKSIQKEVLELLERSICFFKKQKVKVLILGCTELSLLPPKYFEGIKLIDPLEILAQALVEEMDTDILLTNTKFHAVK